MDITIGLLNLLFVIGIAAFAIIVATNHTEDKE